MLAHQALWTEPAHQVALSSDAGGLGGIPFYADAVRAGPALDSAASSRCGPYWGFDCYSGMWTIDDLMRYSTRPQTTIATAKGSPTPAKDARLMGMRPGRKRAADKIEVDDDLKAFLHQTYLQGLTQAEIGAALGAFRGTPRSHSTICKWLKAHMEFTEEEEARRKMAKKERKASQAAEGKAQAAV